MLNFITVDAHALLDRYNIDATGQGLSLYLKNLTRGRSMTPHSWEYENEDAEETLKRWIRIMEKANAKSPWTEEFCSFDLKQVEKFGPQGGIPPIDSKEVLAVIEPLYTPSEYNEPNALEEWFPLAHEFGRKLFNGFLLRERPLSPELVVRYMDLRDTLSTNSGFPHFTRRKKTAPLEVADAKSPNAWLYPAVILLRYYYGKLRPVWMFPMSTNLVEAGYQVQIQNMIKTSTMLAPFSASDYTSPWRGFEYVKTTLTRQWDIEGGVIIGGDTTKMDAHMRPAQMQLVFQIVKWLFQKKCWATLEQSLMHVTDIDLLWKQEGSEVTLIEGVHGLASGSCWTQLSETVLQMFAAYVRGITSGQGIGDDFYWFGDMSAEDVADYLGEFGLPANPDKQSVSEESLTFLQRYYRRGFFSREDRNTLGAYYPTIRALGSILWPENFHKADEEGWSDLFCGRNFMILENCVDDPCFDEFVTFVADGHKDMIPFAKRIMRDNRFAKHVKERMRRLPGLWPSYNQEKQDKPLESFASIALAALL